jgi:hypothetical protein
VVLLLLLGAFEFPGLAGSSAAMLAGAAVPDGQHSFVINPALCVDADRLRAGISYSRPYGLSGLSWGRACAGWSSRRLGAGLGLSLLTIDRYSEQDVQVVVGGTPIPGVAVGLGMHALVVGTGQDYGDFAPAFDAGAIWRPGRIRVGAAWLRLNSPRWHDGTELPPRVLLAGSWQPVDELLLALDLGRQRGDEDAAFGAEFRLIPQLGLRFGVGVAPLRFGAGLGAKVGPVGFEYAYQFHSVLKETHVFGLRAAWR